MGPLDARVSRDQRGGVNKACGPDVVDGIAVQVWLRFGMQCNREILYPNSCRSRSLSISLSDTLSRMSKHNRRCPEHNRVFLAALYPFPIPLALCPFSPCRVSSKDDTSLHTFVWARYYQCDFLHPLLILKHLILRRWRAARGNLVVWRSILMRELGGDCIRYYTNKCVTINKYSTHSDKLRAAK